MGSPSLRRRRRWPGIVYFLISPYLTTLIFVPSNLMLMRISDLFVFFKLIQSSGKSSVLESVVGRDFLPRGSGKKKFIVPGLLLAFNIGCFR